MVIAAITSCTNTSNPSVLIAAGLVARKRALGLKRKPGQDLLAPGSRVVTDYLDRAELSADLRRSAFIRWATAVPCIETPVPHSGGGRDHTRERSEGGGRLVGQSEF